MRATLRSLNKNAKSTKFGVNRTRTLKRLSEFIQLHSETKQLSFKLLNRRKSDSSCNFYVFSRAISEFIEFYQPLVASTFIWSLTTIGVGMVLIEIQLVQ